MSESQKTAVIFGLANKRSIAWAIAQKLHAAGWRLAITYMNERLGLEAKDLIAELPGASGFMCDLTKDDEIVRLYDELNPNTAFCTRWYTAWVSLRRMN